MRHDPVKGRTLFATEDIPEGHFVLPHDPGLSLHLEEQQVDALKQFVADFPDAEMYQHLLDYLNAYGFETQGLGIYGWSVSLACNNTFMNHACSKEEENVKWLETAYLTEDGHKDLTFSPIFTRRAEILSQLSVSTRNIKAGEELSVNYTAFRTDDDKEFNKFLSTVCAEGIGLVPVDESEAEGKDEL